MSLLTMPVSRWRAVRPTWWLVITRPSAEMNEPEPPVLKRTDDLCKWSSHLSVASKPYFFLSSSLGGLLKSQRPSSAGRVLVCINVVTNESERSQNNRFMRVSPRRQDIDE